MTRLLAGAIALILLSAGALLLGWLGANETFIWISILASVGAAVCLALALQRGRSLARSPRSSRSPRSGG